MNLKWIVVFVLVIVTIIFTTQNHETVEIAFLFWSFRTSRAIIIFTALFTGFIFGWVFSFMKKRKK